MSQQHFCILGGGLAGLPLAARLLMAGQTVTLIDNAHPDSASRVAAGMFNVITGKYAVKTWLADTLLEALTDFFEIPHFTFLKKYLHFQPIYRAFKDVAEYNLWLGQQGEDGMQDIIRFQPVPIEEAIVRNPLGGIFIEKCGWLNVAPFLEDLRNVLITDFGLNFIETHLSLDAVHLASKTLQIGDTQLRFDHFILCQGMAIHQNPLWPIPLVPSKGQMLMIAAPELQLPFILSDKVYILPITGEKCIVGATYEWKFETEAPTPEGKATLCGHLDEILHIPYTIHAHKAAVRPASHDRRPVLGTHPQYPHLHVLTGFGTKGVLSFAYFSAVMCRYLLGEIATLDKEYDVKRYYRKGRM